LPHRITQCYLPTDKYSDNIVISQPMIGCRLRDLYVRVCLCITDGRHIVTVYMSDIAQSLPLFC